MEGGSSADRRLRWSGVCGFGRDEKDPRQLMFRLRLRSRNLRQKDRREGREEEAPRGVKVESAIHRWLGESEYRLASVDGWLILAFRGGRL